MRVLLLTLAALLLPILAFAQEDEMGEPGLYVVVMELEEGADETPEGQAALAGHIRNLNQLYDDGLLYMAGPFMDDSNMGVMVLEVADEDTAWSLAESDPSVQSGLMTVIEVHPWWAAFSRPEGRRFSEADFAAMMQADGGEADESHDDEPEHEHDHHHDHGHAGHEH